MTDGTVPLAYDAMGEANARPLYLLHGFPFSRQAWMSVLPSLAARARVIAPDLRGHGASPAGEGPATMEAMARDVLALADKLGHREFDLAGHSMGGYVALALLRLAPDRVRRLALVATRATADSEEARAGRRRQIDLVERQGARALAEALLPKLLAPRPTEIVVEEARRMIEANSVTGLVHALRGMAERPDATGSLPSIRKPTLVVAGGEDQVMPRAELDRLAREIPNARLEVLSASGHLPMLEEPQKLAALLGEFFAPPA